jgi:membrane-bound lytic murein transglycosylase D
MRIPRLADLTCVALAAISCSGPLAHEARAFPFPQPDGLADAVAFWTRVYGELDTASGFIHDNLKLDRIYGTLYLNPDAPPGAQDRVIERTLDKYRRALLQGKLQAPPASIGEVTTTAAWAWAKKASKSERKAAAERLRFQRGQSDRILKGLARSAHWKTKIEAILRKQGVPPELAALPLVESSYNPLALSKAGAAGLWQFMPATARIYLRVDEHTDERLDPIKSSEAAARLLKHNFSRVKHWPLAITAYNHGLSGVKRAVRETGSEDLGVIAATYETERFGFASRNFYASFLAAARVARDPSSYFDTYVQDAADQIGFVSGAFIPVEAVIAELGIEENRLRMLNPALHHAVWNGTQLVPDDYVLQLPGSYASSPTRKHLDELARNFGFASQLPHRYYDVRYGDSLSQIAARYDTTIAELRSLNQLSNRGELRAGQILRVPLLPDPEPLGDGAAAMLAARAALPEEDATPPALGGLTTAAVTRDGGNGATAQAESAHESNSPRGGARQAAADAAQGRPGGAQQSAPQKPVAADAGNRSHVVTDLLDYRVAEDQTIEIQVGETLAHYAEWLRMDPAQEAKLRKAQGSTGLIAGHRLKLDFSRADVDRFESSRIDFHQLRLRRFLQRHRIKGVIEHPVSAGDSLWALAVKRYRVPLWLLRHYNPDIKVDSILAVGSRIHIPAIEVLSDKQNATVAQATEVEENAKPPESAVTAETREN